MIPDYNDVNKAVQEQLRDETDKGQGLDTVMREAQTRANGFRVDGL